MRPLRFLLLLGFCLAVGLPLQALELTQGKIKLSLFEGMGRFSLSYLTSAGTWVPLLSPQDPRTSALSLVLDSRIFTMGDGADFSETTEKTPAGARFIWRSDFLTATESFSFIASSGATGPDGVRIDLTLKNISRQDFTAGVRYLFDTWLGEGSPAAFTTDAGLAVSRETTLSGRTLPRYWASLRAGDPEKLGLQCMVTEDGITQPNRIVFANWKRLSDAPWGYDTSAARDFSLLPYSKNDSAVAQYYDPRPLAQGSQFTVTLVMGRYDPAGYPATPALAAAATDFQSAVQQSVAAEKAAPDRPSALHADLQTLDTILSRVNTALAPGSVISDADLALMESTLKDMASRAPSDGK